MRLAKVLAEMAQIVSWQSTNNYRWDVFVNSEWVDELFAPDEESAIAQYAEENPEIDPQTITVTVDDAVEALDRADIKLINSEQTRRQIESWLNNNNTPYRWAFYIGGEYDPQPTPGIITFHKFGNAGGDPLTPHMILHTAGHALSNRSGFELV